MGRISLLIHGLSEAYLLAGRVQDATEQAARALDFARAHEEQGHQTWALQLLGEIARQARPSEIEPAESYYQ